VFVLSKLLLARADAPARLVRDVSPLVATLHLPELTVVDVREPAELTGALGHIPGAVNVPMGALLTTTAAWDRAAPLLFVCRSGGRSARCARALGEEGFSALFNLTGGMLAWDANALPKQRDPHNRAQSLIATLGLAFVAACEGEVEQGAAALAEALRPDALQPPGCLVDRLADAVATFEGLVSTRDDALQRYVWMLRAGLARVTPDPEGTGRGACPPAVVRRASVPARPGRSAGSDALGDAEESEGRGTNTAPLPLIPQPPSLRRST
jgi:rhodanese-related sulfurtransferase